MKMNRGTASRVKLVMTPQILQGQQVEEIESQEDPAEQQRNRPQGKRDRIAQHQHEHQAQEHQGDPDGHQCLRSPDISPGGVMSGQDFSRLWAPATESIVVPLVEGAGAQRRV